MTVEQQIAKEWSATRRKRLRKCLTICRRESTSGCAMDDGDLALCGPSNCEVYRAVARGFTWTDPVRPHDIIDCPNPAKCTWCSVPHVPT